MDRFIEIALVDTSWEDPIRDEINKEDIEDMAKSILASGQIHPIVVEEREPGKYNGVVGRLRYEATKRAGKSTILARVHSFIDESDKKAWQLIENVVRRGLNPIQVGEGYKKLHEYYKAEGIERDAPIVESIQKQIQDVSGEKAPSEKTIWQYIQFAKDFPEDVKSILKSLADKSFGRMHAVQLLRLKDDHDGMMQMAEWLRDEKPTVVQLKARINDYYKVKNEASKEVKTALKEEKISLKQAATIADAEEEIQESILKMTEDGALKPGQVKKVVDFTKAHEDRTEEILKRGAKNPEAAVAVAEGAEILETKEDMKAFFRTKQGRAEQENFEIPCTCPQCKVSFKKKITVNWEKGEVEFN